MATLIPSLDQTLASSVTGRSKVVERLLQAQQSPFLQGAYLYHRVDVQPELQPDSLLYRFELVIVFPRRGIICVCPGHNHGKVREKASILETRYPRWGEVAWIHYGGEWDEGFWDRIESEWRLMNESADLEPIQHLCRHLDKLMGIIELPPCTPSEQDDWIDSRFMRIGKKSEVQKNVQEQLQRWGKAGGLRLRYDGRAGSGKTIAALDLYREWVAAGRKPLLVCYNHRLGLWLYEQTEGLRGFAGTLFHWARMQLKSHGLDAAVDAHHIKLLQDAIANGNIKLTAEDQFDCLIIDEGQDFRPDWAALIFNHYLSEDGNLVWFEDSHQRILSQDAPVVIGNVTKLVSTQNLRTPQHIARYGSAVLASIAKHIDFDGELPLINSNDIPGWPVQSHVYRGADEAAQLLADRIDALMAEGVPKKNILVLSCTSDAKGLLMSHEMGLGRRLYRFRPDRPVLKRYVGEYDKATNLKVYRPKEGIYCDSIHKVKGLEDYAVLLIDVLPPKLPCSSRDAKDYLDRLYCSITRAKARLEIFVESGNPLAGCFVNSCPKKSGA